jgi:hypothetical protein
VRIGWRTREYERTCQDCGCVWRVPKALAHPHMRGMPMGNVGGTGNALANSVIAENAALSERAAAMRRCPHCESGDYRQRSIR